MINFTIPAIALLVACPENVSGVTLNFCKNARSQISADSFITCILPSGPMLLSKDYIFSNQPRSSDRP